MKEKLLITFIVLSGIIWGTIGYVISHAPVSETVASTAAWKIYKNKYYGFEISYPPNFFVNESSNGDVVHIVRDDKHDLADSNIYIDGDAIKGMDLKYWAEAMSELSFGADYKIRDEVFAGRPAETKYSGTFENIVISNPYESQPGYLRIQANVGDSDSAQMLKTFKFTDQATTTSTSDWKTYVDSNYRFEFKYPANDRVDNKGWDGDMNPINYVFQIISPDKESISGLIETFSDDFYKHVFDEVQKECTAGLSYPEPGDSCILRQQRKFITPLGIPGYELEFARFAKRSPCAPTDHSFGCVAGPIYAYDTSDGNQKKLILLNELGYGGLGESIEEIFDTLKVIK